MAFKTPTMSVLLLKDKLLVPRYMKQPFMIKKDIGKQVLLLSKVILKQEAYIFISFTVSFLHYF